MTRFLRPVSHSMWEVHYDGEIVGSVTARDRGSVIEYVPHDRRGIRITPEQLPMTFKDGPLFDLKAAARAVTRWVDDGRTGRQQYDYERSHGWSTD